MATRRSDRLDKEQQANMCSLHHQLTTGIPAISKKSFLPCHSCHMDNQKHRYLSCMESLYRRQNKALYFYIKFNIALCDL